MTREQLRQRHGTPEEFAAACNRAADTLYITTAECEAAIASYVEEWRQAERTCD